MPHIIRLRGPWTYRVLEQEQQGRIDIEQLNEILPTATGQIELERRFHRPTGLDDSTAVELVIGPTAHAREVQLNDVSLSIPPAAGELRFDVTSLLELNNVLRIVVDGTEAVQFNAVRLEIFAP